VAQIIPPFIPAMLPGNSNKQVEMPWKSQLVPLPNGRKIEPLKLF
jgi:hypothetical protein